MPHTNTSTMYITKWQKQTELNNTIFQVLGSPTICIRTDAYITVGCIKLCGHSEFSVG